MRPQRVLLTVSYLQVHGALLIDLKILLLSAVSRTGFDTIQSGSLSDETEAAKRKEAWTSLRFGCKGTCMNFVRYIAAYAYAVMTPLDP